MERFSNPQVDDSQQPLGSSPSEGFGALWLAGLSNALDEKNLDALLNDGATQLCSQFLTVFFEGALDAMLLVNEAGQCVQANPLAGTLFALPREQLIGRAVAELVSPAVDLSGGQGEARSPIQGELRLGRADGSVRDVAYTVTRNAFPRLHLLVLRDVTEQRQLQASHQKYQTLFEILPIGVSITDAEGKLLEANPASEKILGISSQEHVQRTVDEPSWQAFYLDGSLMPAEDYPSVRALREQRVIQGVEKGILRPDGTVSWLSVNAAPIPLEDYGVAIAYLDITAQKEAEARLRRTRDQYLRANEVGGVGVWDWNLETNDIYLDPILKSLLGYEDEEIRNHIDDWSQHVYAEDLPAVMAAATEHLEGRSPEYHIEHRMVHKDGSLRWFLARGIAVRSPDGKPYRFVGTDIDITAQKETELALQRQSQRERAFNAVVQAVRSSLDLQTIFKRSVAAISAFLDVEVSIVQYLPEEKCWRHLMVYRQGTQQIVQFDTDVPDADNPFAEQLKQLNVVQVNDTATIDDPINQELAQTAPGAWLLVPIHGDGQVWGSLTLGKMPSPSPWSDEEVELAKRIAAQLAIALHQSTLCHQLQTINERYDWIIHSIGEGIWEWDCRDNTLTGSSRFWQILGEACPTESPTSIQVLLDRVHPEDLPHLDRLINQHLQQRSPYGTEIRMRHRQGHYIWIRSRGHGIWDEQGNPIRMLGTIEDISDRKQVETALRQSEAKNRAILAAIPDLMIRIGADGYYREVVTDPMELELFFNGQDPRDLKVADCVPSPNLEQQQYYMQRALETGELQVYEHQMPLPDGWRYEEARVFKSGEDEVLLMVRDISDRKRLEQELQDSRDQLASILNSSFACIVKFRLFADGTIIYDYYSPKSVLIYGYSPDELREEADLWRSRVFSEDLESVILPTIQAIFEGQTQGTLEYRFRHHDGSVRWIQETLSARHDHEQNCWIVTAVAIDISQRKHAEIALQESEAFRRKITDLAPVGLFIYDLDRQTLSFCNPAYEEMLGYTLQEAQALGDEYLPTIYHPDDRARLAAHDRGVLEDRDGRIYELEYTCRRKDGSILVVDSRELVLARDPDGRPTQVLGFGIDITARKVMELALRQREQEFRTLAENAPDCIMRCDRHYRFLYVNPVVARVSSIDSAVFLGKTTQELGFPDSLTQLWQGAIEQAFVTGREQVLEYEIPEEMGCSTYYSRVVPELDELGEVVSVLIMARDITSLKQAQDALIQQAARERTLRLITQHIRETLEFDAILSAAVSEVQQTLQADRTLIFRFNPDHSGIVIQESVEPDFPSILGMQWGDECFPSSCHVVYCQGQARIVSAAKLTKWGDCLSDFIQITGMQSKIVAPITQREGDGAVHLWGLLVVHACAEPRQWQANELELLQQVAEQLAIALQQSELHGQVQQWAATLEQQVQERTVTLQQSLDFDALLKRITDRVRDSLDEDQILETAVQELGQQLNLECCDTGIYNAERTTSTIAHEFTRSLTSAKGNTFAIADATHVGVYPAIFAGQTSLFCDRIPCNLRTDPIRLTIMVCPIRDDQAIWGDMWLMKAAEQDFSDLEVRLVEQVANQCAIALRQARLFKAAQTQVTELERLHKLKDDFLSTVSHELRTPMASIKMATELLEVHLKRQRVLPVDFPDEIEEGGAIARYFQILQHEGKREISLIDDLLDLTRLDAKTEPLSLSAVQLQDWLPYLLETFMTRTQQHHQHLATDLAPDLPVITTDLSYLQRIVTELLNNACKYTPPGESIVLHASTKQASLQLAIANSGVEIPEAERDRIFERFYRIPNGDPWKHGGTGLGLALVKAMVEYLNGTIWVESDNGETRFVIQLPLYLDAIDLGEEKGGDRPG